MCIQISMWKVIKWLRNTLLQFSFYIIICEADLVKLETKNTPRAEKVSFPLDIFHDVISAVVVEGYL